MKDCLFCQIVKRKVPSEIIYEDDDVLAFKDISPTAPVHLLIVPKIHVDNLAKIGNNKGALLGKILLVAKQLAEKNGINETGYKVVTNNGKGAGQVIFHLHFHLIGGWKENKKINLP